MIAFVKGRLVEKTPGHALIDCNGLGYELRISAKTYESLTEEQCMLLTHYSVSVDVRGGASSHQLFGFSEKRERDLFRQLITVSGVSATIGMTILSQLNVSQLERAIFEKDDKLFKAVKGIGPKLAQRIVMDLSEKVIPQTDMVEGTINSGNIARQEALVALCSLGFDRVRADRTLSAVIKESKAELDIEQMIKKSLKAL
jgi:holliday junction DNA helicase RuvA